MSFPLNLAKVEEELIEHFQDIVLRVLHNLQEKPLF